MSDSGSTGFRDLATGVISGFAALATAAAGVLGVLHETGYLGSQASIPKAASVSVASNSTASAMPSLSEGESQAEPSDLAPGTMPNREHRRLRARRRASAEAETAIASANAAPIVAPPPEAGASGQPLIALNGAWTDFGPGFCHTIKQTGNKVEVVNFAPITNTFISVGHGTISGRSVHLEMNDLHPAAAVGDMILSFDGKKLLGTLRRKDGEHPLVWHRKDAPCG